MTFGDTLPAPALTPAFPEMSTDELIEDVEHLKGFLETTDDVRGLRLSIHLRRAELSRRARTGACA